MAESKPECKYGSSCYRKNPQHLEKYSHSKDTGTVTQNDVNSNGISSRKRKKLQETTDDDTPLQTKHVKLQMSLEVSTSNDDKLKETIQRKFLVQMPEDFYQFWDFCCSLAPNDPLNALVSSLELVLVGPYHVLAGKLKDRVWSDCVLHYRYFYDPPELVTILKENGDRGYHIGYYRDVPSSVTDTFMVSNVCAEGCVLSHVGLNIFAAVRNELQKKLKNKHRLSQSAVKELQTLDGALTRKATELGLNIKDIKPTNRKIVTKCFNAIGMCVPVDKKLEIGYRPLTMTNKELKRLLDKIVSCDPNKRDIASEPLQEMMTYIQFANDECDYGMGLELGIDLFCYGSSEFDSEILRILPLAYDLLERNEFGKILEAHLSRRQKTPLDFT